MASDEQPTDLPLARKRDERTPALSVVAAVSAAGLLAARLRTGPLLFLAGVAAAGWLARRRNLESRSSHAILPELLQEIPLPPAESDSKPQVDAWLSSQIAREKQSPVITLDLLGSTTPPVQDPEKPIHCLPDLPEVGLTPEMPSSASLFKETPASSEPFAPPPSVRLESVPLYGLSESPSSSLEENPFFSASVPVPEWEAATNVTSLQDLETPTPAPSLDSTWLLGIEPLPSWDEVAESPADVKNDSPSWMQESQVPSFETVDPSVAVPAPQTPFVPSLFQGGALPDEIYVPPSSEPERVPWNSPLTSSAVRKEPLPVTSLLDTPLSVPSSPPLSSGSEPQDEEMTNPAMPRPVFVAPRRTSFLGKAISAPAETNAPAAEPATATAAPTKDVQALPELSMTLAAPGEASFDDPLSALDQHGSPGADEKPQPPLRPSSQVIDAEIVVRPRGLRNASVIAKTPTGPLAKPAADFRAENQEGAKSGVSSKETVPVLPQAPVVVPREQRARKTWRSWWRGE